jgi:hypothetical protein
MKKIIFRLMAISCLAISSLLSAQSNVHFDPTRDIIRDSVTRVIDRNDINTQTELIPIPETTYKGVNDLIALPNPIKQGELLTLSFWIEEANTFTVTISTPKGSPIEVQKIGSLAKGAHNLSLEIGMLNAGEYGIEIKGETDVFGKTKFTVIE